MNTRLLRASLASLMVVLLLSCGGGSGGGGPGGAPRADASAQGAGAALDASPAGDGGAGASASTGGATSTAAAGGGEDSGVGSGGTGVSTADSGTSVGGVDGMGSIIVGGLRYNVDQATVDLRDASELKLGMSIAVTGPMDAAFVTGTARQWQSAAELRGVVGTVDETGGSFKLMGSTVGVDAATAWGDLQGLASLSAGSTVQVWGLPVAGGRWLATRIETRSPGSPPIVAGVVAQLDVDAKTFLLGGLRVSYARAGFGPGLAADQLANGLIVRVRADQPPLSGLLDATQLERWYAIPVQVGVAVQLEGVISGYASPGAFGLLGRTVDAFGAQLTGGLAGTLGNGVRVVASGTLSADGVLVASQLKIRHAAGGGALPSYALIGKVGAYTSLSNFRVQGQQVDAANAVVENGSPGTLANGVDVTVQGVQVVNGVLIASRIRFD
jgi:hypothetical protein